MARKLMAKAIAIANVASWYLTLMLVALILLSSLQENSSTVPWGKQLMWRPCDEIYVVREGETLHTISDKCGDPFIIEQNPHINDPDDVFPGLVIKITPSNPLHRAAPFV